MNIKSAIMKEKTYLLLFVLPAGLLVFIFFLLPNILNFYYSLTDWNSYTSEINFIGLANIKEIISDRIIIKDTITTIKYAAMVAVLQNGVALILALALEKTTRQNAVFRTIIFIPVLLSTLAASYIFKGIYQPDGPLNAFLSAITVKEIDFAYLGSMTFALFFIAVVAAWKGLGIGLIVYIAGLNVIPEELIEAARVEGASYLRVMKNIKLPLLGPAFTFNIVTSLISSLSTIELALSLTNGGPARATEVLNLIIMRNFGFGRWGYSVAISLLLFLIVCVFAFPLVIILKKREIEL